MQVRAAQCIDKEILIRKIRDIDIGIDIDKDCSVLAISDLGADHHFLVKTRFRILVESSFI